MKRWKSLLLNYIAADFFTQEGEPESKLSGNGL